MIAAILFAATIAQSPEPQQISALCDADNISKAQHLTPPQITALRAMKPKSEFETSEQFNTRIRSIIGGGIVAGSVKVAPSLVKYDADAGATRIRAVALPLAGIGLKVPSQRVFDYYDMAEVSSGTTSGGSYIGQNAFGATAKVNQRTDHNFGIAWNSMAAKFNPEAQRTIPMAPAEAKSANKQLRLLLVGTLEPPFLVDDTEYSGATVDAPINLEIQQRAVIVTPVCSVLYDEKTGAVLDHWLASKGYR